MPKKKWEKPKLIVLVRGKSTERVLTNCKEGTEGVGGGPEYGYRRCAGWQCSYQCDDFWGT